MKRLLAAGYTIVEVMMFLLVSSALLTSAMIMMNGREERLRFTQSAETLQAKLGDVLNDVSTGFYPSAQNIKCTVPAGEPVLTEDAGTIPQGTNKDCIFLGKALQLGPLSDYNIYTMVALRDDKDLETAHITLMGLNGSAGLVDKQTTLADLQIRKIVSLTDPSRDLSGIALVSDFSRTSSLDDKLSGNASRVTLHEVLSTFASNAGTAAGMPKAEKGVVLCLRQGDNGREASLKVEGDGQRLSTGLKIDDERYSACID